jgi:hypothetical protein
MQSRIACIVNLCGYLSVIAALDHPSRPVRRLGELWDLDKAPRQAASSDVGSGLNCAGEQSSLSDDTRAVDAIGAISPTDTGRLDITGPTLLRPDYPAACGVSIAISRSGSVIVCAANWVREENRSDKPCWISRRCFAVHADRCRICIHETCKWPICRDLGLRLATSSCAGADSRYGSVLMAAYMRIWW